MGILELILGGLALIGALLAALFKSQRDAAKVEAKIQEERAQQSEIRAETVKKVDDRIKEADTSLKEAVKEAEEHIKTGRRDHFER